MRSILERHISDFIVGLYPQIERPALIAMTERMAEGMEKAAQIGVGRLNDDQDAAFRHGSRMAVYLMREAFNAFKGEFRQEMQAIARAHFDALLKKDAAEQALPSYKGVPLAPWQFDALMRADGYTPADTTTS